MSTGQQSKFKQVLTYVLMAVYIGGICVGCLVLGGTLSEFGEIYQLQADPDVEGRSPPYDRPFVAGDSLRLVEKERFRLDFWQLEIANGGSVLIAVPNQPIGLRIYYPGYLKAVSGYWRGEKAAVTIWGCLELDLIGQPGNPDFSWGTTLQKGAKAITPYFDMLLPIDEIDLSVPWEQRVMRVSTQFTVEYPQALDIAGFRDSYETIKHDFELVILVPDEVEEYLVVRRDERLRRGLPLLLGGIALGLLVIAASVILPNKAAKKWKL